MRPDVKEAYAPVDDPAETAKRVAAWSLNFLGDISIPEHCHIENQEVPPIHRRIYQMLAEEHRYQYLTSPREFAKTTVDSLVWPLYCVCYELEPFIVIIGKVGKSGSKVLKNIKREMRQNPKIIDVYGRLVPNKSEGLVDSQFEIQFRNGILIRSIGMMGDIRGEKDAMNRPTLIILDDPQAIKHIKEPSTLESHQEWFDRDVIFAIDKKKGKIKFIGNLLSKTCLLYQVMQDERFVGINFSALVDNEGNPDHMKGHSIWETRHPTADLHAERKAWMKKGKLHVWMAERMNIIMDELEKKIKLEVFHDCSFQRINDQNILVSDAYIEPIRVNTYLAVDPAFADTEDSDERALIVFAKGRILKKPVHGEPYWFNMLWVLEYIYNHMSPELIIDRTLELHKRYYFTSVIIEAIGGAQLYKPFMMRATVHDTFFSKHPFSPTYVKYQPQNKKDRIYAGLQPRAAYGQIAVRPDMEEMIDEGENFALKKSPHLLDALEFGNRYSDECVEQFSNLTKRQRDWLTEIDEEQDREERPFGAPSSLDNVLGIG